MDYGYCPVDFHNYKMYAFRTPMGRDRMLTVFREVWTEWKDNWWDFRIGLCGSAYAVR